MTAPPVTGIRTVIVGASGRMGQQLLQLMGEFPQLQLHGAVASGSSGKLGQDAMQGGSASSGVKICASLGEVLQGAQLVLDFSRATAAANTLAECVRARVPLLIGTTGLPEKFDAALADAARTTALLLAPNTSLAVGLLTELVRQAASDLPDGYDIEIVETHHRGKRDAPSGTAIALGTAAAQGRGIALEQQGMYGRHGTSEPRPTQQIGFSSVRGGDVVGEHEVWFLGQGERLLLKHCATDRAVFARGALFAARWLAGQQPGRYAMSDVFKSKSN